LRIVPDASPQAVADARAGGCRAGQAIHDVLEEGVWDNADGVKTIRAALLG
jgi:hypothetical protein